MQYHEYHLSPSFLAYVIHVAIDVIHYATGNLRFRVLKRLQVEVIQVKATGHDVF